MSAENDLALAYHMGYDDALAKHKPDASKVHVFGRGTCHECAGMDDVFECSACGGRYEGWALKRWARYCPDCGRKVVTNG